MNRTIAIAAGMALAGVMLPGAATADGTGKWYATAAVGMAFPGNGDGNSTDVYGKTEYEYDFDNGFGFSGGVGYDLSPLRVEGVLSWLKADLKSVTTKSIETPDPDPDSDLEDLTNTIGTKVDEKGDISALSVMGNVWWDIDTGSAVTPFVGGGIGMTQLTIRGEGESSVDDWVFAWQIGAGMSYDLGNGTAAQLGYRFFNPGEADFDSLNYEPGGMHIVEAGVRFSF